jgi:hypothetical protein
MKGDIPLFPGRPWGSVSAAEKRNVPECPECPE